MAVYNLREHHHEVLLNLQKRIPVTRLYIKLNQYRYNVLVHIRPVHAPVQVRLDSSRVRIHHVLHIRYNLGHFSDVYQADVYNLVDPPFALFLSHVFYRGAAKYAIRDGNHLTAKGTECSTRPPNVDHNAFDELALAVELDFVANAECVLQGRNTSAIITLKCRNRPERWD